MASGIVEGERSHALLDRSSAAAVLDFVEQRSTLALPAEQRTREIGDQPSTAAYAKWNTSWKR